jgi:hypothetical protein
MERGQRIGLIVAAVVVAVVAVVLLSGGDDDDSDSTTTTTATQAETPAGEPTATVPAPKPKPSVNTIRVVGGEPEGGAQDITVNKGETVRIKVESPDTSGEVHVHGYDFIKDLEAGGSVTFSFKADIEGVFEIELEETKTPLAELSVEP